MNNSTNNKDRKGAKVSFKSMIIAMIIALLGFLGFGGFELGNGDGADTNAGNESGIVSETEASKEENASETTKTKDGSNVDESNSQLDGFVLYVREDKLFISSDDEDTGFKEVTIAYVEEVLNQLKSDDKVIIYDDGAINKTYEDIVGLIDLKVEEIGIRKIEDKITN